MTAALASLLVLLLLPLAPIASPAERFIRASDLYRAEDFASAAETLSALAAEGFESGPLHYNLGNAEYRQGRLGRAIAAYLRASDFTPREADLDYNLRIVRARRADAAPEGAFATPTFLRSLLFPHTLLTVREEIALAGGFWLAGLLLLHVALFVRRAAARRAGVVLVALALVTAGSALYRIHDRNARPPGVVVAAEASVRTGPGEEYPVTFTLHDGYELRVLERDAGWAKVEVDGDKRGWLAESDLAILPSLVG